MIGEIVIALIFMIPLYAFFIWTYNCPEDSFLFGRRWKYEEEPEVSSDVIRYMKFTSIVAMIGSPIVIFTFFLKQSVFGLALMAFMFVIVVGAVIIFTGKSKT
ncbi:hypothetical protein [Paenisporosarcina indica]|uniref:hypothetical protein n=1 Tax=Paenisporosarcina indica TaxID=650093 RepID=UPI00094FEE8E|nr:hypothetical protein [Paenisporosarcina indica]